LQPNGIRTDNEKKKLIILAVSLLITLSSYAAESDNLTLFVNAVAESDIGKIKELAAFIDINSP
jgi:hypothetical protein